jgi:phosphoribosylaminoimidazole-succinocarboxamide synthase
MLAESYLRSGKVRDLYRLNDGRVVLVASDRISAFDVVLPSVIPDKGRVLTALSRFWFAETGSIIRNHLLDTAPEVLERQRQGEIHATGHEPVDLGPLDGIRGRIMICRPVHVLPVEAVARGYLAGSGWKEYRERGTVCGIALPPGLRESDPLPEPIFTPATKAEGGEHDENITFDEMIEHLGTMVGGVTKHTGPLAEAIRDRTLRLYRYGAAVAARRGVILADTKFEFGLPETGEALVTWRTSAPTESSVSWTTKRAPGAEIPPEPQYSGIRPEPIEPGQMGDAMILIDEVMTPDSSRFWDAATYEPGRPQASFDKQFVRDWLEAQAWNKTAPGPALPPDVIEGTRARYIEAYERITGASFKRYLEEDVIAP